MRCAEFLMTARDLIELRIVVYWKPVWHILEGAARAKIPPHRAACRPIAFSSSSSGFDLPMHRSSTLATGA